MGVIQQRLLALISIDQAQGSLGAKAYTKPDPPVESSMELYILVVLVGLSVVCLWETARACCRRGTERPAPEAHVRVAREERQSRKIQEAVARALEEGIRQRRPGSSTSGFSPARSSEAQEYGLSPQTPPARNRISALKRLTPTGMTPPSPDTRVLLNRQEREAASDRSGSLSASPQRPGVSLRAVPVAASNPGSPAPSQGPVFEQHLHFREPPACAYAAQGTYAHSSDPSGQASASSAQARPRDQLLNLLELGGAGNQGSIQERVDTGVQTDSVLVFGQRENALVTVNGGSLHKYRCRAIQKSKSPQFRQACQYCLSEGDT